MFDELLGRKFEEGASGPATFDCFGLYTFCCRQNGVRIPDYPREDATLQVLKAFDEGWYQLSAPLPGCAVLMKFREGPHVGYYEGDGWFLHIQVGSTVSRGNLERQPWRSRIEGFYEYRDVVRDLAQGQSRT